MIQNSQRMNLQTSTSVAFQNITSKTLFDVLKYGSAAFFISSLVEYITPTLNIKKKNNMKDVLFLIFQVIAHIFILIIGFMYISLSGGARFGILTYIMVSIACSTTLLNKIETIRKEVFQLEPDSKFEALEKTLEKTLEKKSPVCIRNSSAVLKPVAPNQLVERGSDFSEFPDQDTQMEEIENMTTLITDLY
jgi:hypothetical protein